MTQLGRISGPLLEANLVRNGVDLTFRNYSVSDDLLYLDVTNNRIGVNKTPASHKLEVDGYTRTTDLITDTQAQFGNILISTNTFSTYVVSNITVSPNQSNPIITADHIKAGDLSFKDNIISNYSVNGNVRFDPNGTGILDVQSSATVNGDLTVTGNIGITGNLSEYTNIIVGNAPIDTVVIAPDFTQSIIPGDNVQYDLGSVSKRWKNVYSHSNANIGSLIFNDVTISDQMFIESSLPSISTLLSNEDLELLPDTGIIQVEDFRIQGNTILNATESMATIVSSGIGYVRFTDAAGLVVPSGTDAERAGFVTTPEVGATRWNTDNPLDNYLECFDGTTWNIATGPGGSISTVENYDLANAYILILG